MMDSVEYELISDTESVDDDQQQICTTSYDLESNGRKKSRNPYKCNKCKFSSNEEAKLLKHEINHSKEYPFRCTMCEKRFRIRSNCDRHISSHKGERNHTCPVCKKSFTTKANCQRHMENHKEAAGPGNGYCHSAAHSNLIEEKDGIKIKDEHGAPPKVIKTKKIDRECMIDIAALEEDNKKENTYESRNFNSKRTLDGSNSDNKVQRKRHKLFLDKEKKLLTITDCLYSDKDANINSTKLVSDKDYTNKSSLKNIISNDNETEIDLPALASPRKRFQKSSRKLLTQSENNILPGSKKNNGNRNKEHGGDNFGSCSATIDMLSKGPLDLENGMDVPRLDDFEFNLNNAKEFTSKNSAFEIVVDKEGKRNKNYQSVSKRNTSGDALDGNQLDKTPGISKYFYGNDAQAEGGNFDANEFSISNDLILTSSVQHFNGSNSSEKQKAEQKQTPEYSSISVDNSDMKILSDSFPVPSKFNKPDIIYTRILSTTQTEGIDSIFENKFEAKTIKRKTEKEKQQKDGIGKENNKVTSNNVRQSSFPGSFPKKIEQPVRTQFWDHNNLIRKILVWNPVWFDEYEKLRTTPPDISKDVNHFLTAYESRKDYFKTVLPHLLLETWESCIQEWHILKGKRPVTKCVFCNRNDTDISIFSNAYFTVKDHSFNKDDVLILRSSTGDGRYKASMCYIEDITYKLSNSIKSIPTYCHADTQGSSAEKCNTVLKLQLKSSHFEMFPSSKKCESTLEFVHSLRDVLSIYNGLATSFETQLIRHVLKPGNIDIFKSISTEHKERDLNVLVNENDYNAIQRTAILNAADLILERNISNRVCLIRGPFGTGKTDILIGIIKAVFQRSGGKCCIALCAPSQVAVENHMKRLIRERQKMQLKKTGLLLIGDDSNYHPDVQAYSHKTHVQNEKEHFKRTTATSSVVNEIQRLNVKISIIEETEHSTESNKKEMNTLLKKRNELTSQISEERLEKDVLLRGKVICGTFRSFGEQLYLNVLSSVKNNCRKSIFTCMLMDEAQQASELETLLPLQYGPNKLIMAGDLEQLAPTVKSELSRDKSFDQSLFERLCDHFRFHGDKNTVLVLKTQYRSHPEIAKFPSEMFYGRHLDTHRYLKERSETFNLKPYIVFSIEREQTVTAVDITISLCEFLYSFVLQNTRLNHKDFGIITAFDQISKIKEGFANSKLVDADVEVDTVTGFQGRSKEIIILSCTGSSTEKNGFLTCHKELNVALTRARSALYIVGNLDTLSEENEALQKLVADAKDRKVLRIVKEDYVSKDIFRACLSAKARLGR
ncbi:probable helicase senataxin [Mytilus californianus]|uniref:probable helicase senataxin n=1 Tax=Mytilus californianus TaxID=6549 RepID=UPI0022461882|nr:probable helicase senataxin [Mytilus californianus]